MNLCEVARVRRQKQAALTCRKAQLRIVALGIHSRLKRRQHVEAPGAESPNELVAGHILIDIKCYHAGSGRLLEEAEPFS